MNEFNGYYDVEDDFEGITRVYDDCSCEGNYICRKCLSKW